MRIPKLSGTATLLAMVVLTVGAQEKPVFEYGQVEELRGLKRVFIDTGADLKARNSILKEIKKKLPSLIVNESPTDAEVLLVYGSTNETRLVGARTTPVQGTDATRTRPVYDAIKKGTGYVAKKGSNGTLRVLVGFEGANDHLFSKSPDLGFARAFIKAYNEANK